MRDIRGDYQRAYLDEYAQHRRAGRDDQAETVAVILRDHFGVDVEAEVAEPAPEQATAEPAPENAAEPKPAARRARPAKPKE